MRKTLALLVFLPSVAMADPGADLERFVGSWKGTGTVTMGKDKLKIAATWDCKRAAGTAAVECASRVTGIPGMTMEELDLFGYDPGAGAYHWFAVSNLGEAHDHVAKGKIDHLEFAYAGIDASTKKPMTEKLVLDSTKDGKTIKGHTEAAIGGQCAMGIDLELHK